MGLDLGEQLKTITPEIIFVFSGINFEPFVEFIDGIEAAFEPGKIPLIVGGTGDGFYETDAIGEIGASALAINSEGQIDFQVACEDFTLNQSNISAFDVLTNLKNKMPDPTLVMGLCDFHSDGSLIVEEFNSQFNSPLFGGFLGSGRITESSYGFVNRNVMRGTLVFVGFKFKPDSNLVYDIQSGSGWNEIGEKGIVTEAEQTKLTSINNAPAVQFLEDATGNSCKAIDKGIIAFKVREQGTSEAYIRSIANIAESVDHSGITLYGHVKAGSTITVCNGDPEVVKAEVSIICQRIKKKNIIPECALVISCAGRKWLLVDKISHEVNDVFDVFEKKFPVSGFPSYGEFAPLVSTPSKSKNGFFNVTYVILVIGKKNELL